MIRRGALRTWRADAGAALLLALGTVPYVAVWPRDFVPGDEGLFLYEAKRILEGDVIYRDFFEVIAPGSLYLTTIRFQPDKPLPVALVRKLVKAQIARKAARQRHAAPAPRAAADAEAVGPLGAADVG